MQHMNQPNNNQNGNSQVQSIMITAITLFALAGAILGFSIGALTHRSSPGTQASNNANTNSSTNKPAKTTQTAVTPTATPSAPAQKLAGPAMTMGTPLTGTYQYVFTAQAVYDGTTTYVKADGITCRLWITKSDPSKLDASSFKIISNLQQTVPDEVAGGLIFDAATPQTQPCVKGLGTWNVNLSSSLPKGSYYVVGLTDWNGTYFNWSWRLATQP